MAKRLLLMNEGFRISNQTKARYRVECGSAGSGKSVNVARDYIAKLSDARYKGANLLCVRKTESSHLDSTYAELCRAIRDIFGEAWGKYWEISRSPMKMHCKHTGASVLFRGTRDEEQREKLKSIQAVSGKITWVWIEEATELDGADLDIIDDRLRGKLENDELYYQITLTFNPVSASHWIKKRFFDRDDESVFTHRSSYLQNAFIDKEYHLRMMRRRELDPEGYRVYGLGEWGESEGLILPHYQVKRLEKSHEHYDRVFLGQDFGYNHASCILTVGIRDGDVYVLDELYRRYLDTSELIAIANEIGIPKNVTMWCDSAEPDRIKAWRRGGYRAMPVSKEKGSVHAQIDYLKAHRLIIDPSCENLIRELSLWKWQRDAISGELTDDPVCVNDDAIASLRYAIEAQRKGGTAVCLDKRLLGL
ncbi:MAG: PBSX family phage terminase large subunit [Clostridia bacterium]|nr:PBSX family phage terminase large subunit [Clostridia bacterium]